MVYAENHQGVLEPVTPQLVQAARKLAGDSGEVAALVLASPASAVVERVRTIGVDRVWVVSNDPLSSYNPEAWAKAVAEAVSRLSPGAFLCGHTFQGMDIAPWVAARLGLRLVSNCFDLSSDGARVSGERIVYGGAWQVRVSVPLDACVVFSLARRGSAEGPVAAPAPVSTLDVCPDSLAAGTQVVDSLAPAADADDITRADVVVGVGRGIRDPANIRVVEELAAALGGVVACSRPLVDLEWLPYDRQVGASGKEIAPKVYIACGISGAAQHLAGIRGAQTIIAINKDARAPIFGVCDYGVAADLLEVLPALATAVKARRQSVQEG